MARSDNRLVAVANSTPLIALSMVGHLGLLRALFDEIVVPASVYEEVVQQGRGRSGSQAVAQADWLAVREPEAPSPLPAELMGLDEGELDVILLAREIEADWALIDEKLARQIAMALDLPVKGTLGLLLVAYQVGLLSREEALEATHVLAQSSVRLSAKLLRWFDEQLGSKHNAPFR